MAALQGGYWFNSPLGNVRCHIYSWPSYSQGHQVSKSVTNHVDTLGSNLGGGLGKCGAPAAEVRKWSLLKMRQKSYKGWIATHHAWMENYKSPFFFITKTKNYHNNKGSWFTLVVLTNILTNHNRGIAFLLPEPGKNEFATSIVPSFVLQECWTCPNVEVHNPHKWEGKWGTYALWEAIGISYTQFTYC